MTQPGYTVRLSAAAVRSLAKLPPRVAEPLVAFIFGSLGQAPKTRGKPLRDDLDGLWSARRGDYRVIYQIVESEVEVLVIRVGHRGDVYRAH